MKRKRAVLYLIIFAMAVSFFAGETSSQAKKKSISLNYKKLTLKVGQKKRLKVRGTSNKAKWSSSNKKVAAVSKKGVVKAKKKGKAVITAKMGKWKQKARIIVKAKKMFRQEIIKATPNRQPEQRSQLKQNGRPKLRIRM